MPDILYHYCSLDSFCQITKNSSLRLSDITKSNDSDEIKFMFDIYVRYLDEKYKGDPLPSKENLEKEIRSTLDSIKIYCFCLSKSEDDLSQWRGYAPSGGISIGFDEKMLKEYASRISVPGEKVKLEKVEYMDKYNSNLNYHKFESTKYDSNTPANNIAEILKISPQYKNIGFQAENEYRLYFPNRLPENEMELPYVFLDGIKYNMDCRLRENGDIRSYYELPIPFSMVKKIWIGPKLDVSPENVSTFLKRYHPDCSIEVLKTELTYR